MKSSQSFDSRHQCQGLLSLPAGRQGLTLHFDKLSVLSLSMEAAIFALATKGGLSAVGRVNEERNEIRDLRELFCLWREQSERVAIEF